MRTLLIIALLLSAADAASMIRVHRLDDLEIAINPDKIAGLTETVHKKGSPHRLMHENANCIVTMGNGRFQGIKETCREVEELIEKEHVHHRH